MFRRPGALASGFDFLALVLRADLTTDDFLNGLCILLGDYDTIEIITSIHPPRLISLSPDVT